MKWFGPYWGAMVNTECEETPTPIGEACARCERPFVEGDQGLQLPYVSEAGGPATVSYHKACLLEAIGLPLLKEL